jgi:hypothetical protein
MNPDSYRDGTFVATGRHCEKAPGESWQVSKMDSGRRSNLFQFMRCISE